MADLHSETGNHQDQVKVLIEKTASSLDYTALKMLFVSVQQNNIDLSVQYAINRYDMFSLFLRFGNDFFFSLSYKIGEYNTVCSCHRNPNDYKADLIQELLIWCTLSWFGHSYVSGCSIHWTGIHDRIVFSKCQRKICKYLPSLKIIIY